MTVPELVAYLALILFVTYHEVRFWNLQRELRRERQELVRLLALKETSPGAIEGLLRREQTREGAEETNAPRLFGT